MEEKQNTKKFPAGKPEGIRPHLGDLRVDGRIIVNQSYKNTMVVDVEWD